MIAEIWNDISEWTIDDLLREGNEHCRDFSDFFLQKAQKCKLTEEQNGINERSIERYCDLCSFLFSTIKNYYSKCESNSLPPRIICWTVLGSIMESTLQMFLAFYRGDYQKSEWQQWNEFKKEDVINALDKCFDEMIQNKLLLDVHEKKIKKAIMDKIKQHTKTPIHKVMLDDLISFYTSKDDNGKYTLFENEDSDNSEIHHLRTIQKYRNGIHSFQDREIGDWEELFTETKFLCYIQQWIMQRMPIDSGIELLNKFLHKHPDLASNIFFCCAIDDEGSGLD